MSIDREFISQVVIVLAVCAGAWTMIVQPKATEVARLEAKMAESAGGAGLSSQEGIEALAGKVTEYKRRLEVIRRRNGEAEDTSALYATIMRLATESGVRVQAIQPTPAREDNGKPAAVRVARLEMTLSGPFPNIARFVDRMGEIDAFIRPAALQMIPIDGETQQAVSARYACDVLAFTIDAALAGVGETTNGQS